MADTYTYNLASADEATKRLSRVRKHIPDREAPFTFSDVELNDYLDENANNVKLAAADALESKATDEAFVQKVQTTLGVATNGAATAGFVTSRATMLREQAKAALDALASADHGDTGSPSTAPYAE